jgi:hypothetical protein
LATLLETITSAIQESLGGDPPPPEILTGLEDRLAQLSQVSLGWGENGIETWLQHFRALFNDQLLRDTLLSRTLQRRLPRLAAALTFLGVITYKFNGDRVQALPIDWQRLDALINRPGPAASDLNWWFSHLQKLVDIKLLQAYVMLAIFAPADLLRREYPHNNPIFSGFLVGIWFVCGWRGSGDGIHRPYTKIHQAYTTVNHP